MTIDRIRNITSDAFLATYVVPNKPVIIEEALSSWSIAERWTPAYLERLVGSRRTQVYNNYFDLQDDPTLSEFLREEFERADAPAAGSCRYVRWYTKLRDVDFDWADDVFALLADNWRPLPFLPDTDYVLPHARRPARLDPRRDNFPARGLFISGRGARTSLHVDPWGSDAVLCQLFGEKRWTMYDPSQGPLLCVDGACVDPDDVDRSRFPRFAEARPTHEFQLRAGDVVYVPHGWFHHVVTDTPSISLTWNFVHAATAEAFVRWLDTSDAGSQDREVARFMCGVANDGQLRELAVNASSWLACDAARQTAR